MILWPHQVVEGAIGRGRMGDRWIEEREQLLFVLFVFMYCSDWL
jgi:biotin-(acetyl-CoA carboxylase) ligase